MSEEGPSDSVLQFIGHYVESVEHLEILLALYSSQEACSVDEVFRSIQSSRASVEQRLAKLQAAALISRDPDGRYRFNPADQRLRDIVAELEYSYRKMRVRIIEAIYVPKKDAVQTFADAFRLRREK